MIKYKYFLLSIVRMHLKFFVDQFDKFHILCLSQYKPEQKLKAIKKGF